MKTFYITFAIGSIFAKYYLQVKAVDETKAREFCRDHVPGWAGIYDDHDFVDQPRTYGLKAFPPIESRYFLYPSSLNGELVVPE